MTTIDIEPWIVIVGDERQSLAMWRMSDNEQPSVALFSSEDKARQYVAESKIAKFAVIQPQPRALIQLLIDCYTSSIRWAALDPTPERASRVFELRQVLKAARDSLVSPGDSRK